MKKIIFLSFFLLISSFLSAQTFVVDSAGFLDSTEVLRLEKKLIEFEQRTGNEIAIRLISSLEGETIEEYANKLFNELGIGKAGQDNGILILASRNDRKIRIEVGYGLEAQVTDLLAKHIIDEAISPNFKIEYYFQALWKATDILFGLIEGSQQEINNSFLVSDYAVDISQNKYLSYNELEKLNKLLKELNQDTSKAPIIFRMEEGQNIYGEQTYFYLEELYRSILQKNYYIKAPILVYLNLDISKEGKMVGKFSEFEIVYDSTTYQRFMDRKVYPDDWDLVDLNLHPTSMDMIQVIKSAYIDNQNLYPGIEGLFMVLAGLRDKTSSYDEVFFIQEDLLDNESFIDKVAYFSEEEKSEVIQRIKKIERETGSKVFVRITQNNFIDFFEQKYAKALFKKLNKKYRKENPITLFYYDLHKDTKEMSSFFIADWGDLAEKLTQKERDDPKYYYKYSDQKIIDTHFKEDVLDDLSFRDNTYEGLIYSLDLVKKLLKEEINSTNIDAPYDKSSGSVFRFFGYSIGGIVSIFFGHSSLHIVPLLYLGRLDRHR